MGHVFVFVATFEKVHVLGHVFFLSPYNYNRTGYCCPGCAAAAPPVLDFRFWPAGFEAKSKNNSKRRKRDRKMACRVAEEAAEKVHT